MTFRGFDTQPHLASPKRGGIYVLIFISLIFFCSYFYLHGNEVMRDIKTGSSHQIISNQPDEMANYFFIKELVLKHSFGTLELLNEMGLNQIHPRSMTVIGDRLAPIGFPFFIIIVVVFAWIPTVLLGLSFFNLFAISLVPILAVGSNFLLYGIIKRFWNERMALISSLLLYLLPPWWYWASHPFQHTISFVFFLLLAVYGLVRSKEIVEPKIKICFATISAFGIALALALRPNEAVWVLGIYGYLVYRNRAMISKQQIGAWIGTVLLVVLLFFVVQSAFYGSMFASGYVKPLSTGEGGSVLTGGQGVSFVRAFFFPFGINISVALKTAYRYFFFLFNSWTLWAFISIFFAIFRGDKLIRRYFVGWAFLSLYLIFSYGSWNFVDNLLGIPSVGSSQVRYFMPIYVGMIPLIAYFCDCVLSLYSRKKQIVLFLIFGGLFTFSSYSAVFSSFPEGLTRVKQTVGGYAGWQEKIYSLVPENSIVVTRYADKYIFPGRKVIIRTMEETVWADSVKKLSQLNVPLWWYDLKLSSEEQGKVDELLSASGLELGEIEASWDNLELRPIELKK